MKSNRLSCAGCSSSSETPSRRRRAPFSSCRAGSSWAARRASASSSNRSGISSTRASSPCMRRTSRSFSWAPSCSGRAFSGRRSRAPSSIPPFCRSSTPSMRHTSRRTARRSRAETSFSMSSMVPFSSARASGSSSAWGRARAARTSRPSFCSTFSASPSPSRCGCSILPSSFCSFLPMPRCRQYSTVSSSACSLPSSSKSSRLWGSARCRSRSSATAIPRSER